MKIITLDEANSFTVEGIGIGRSLFIEDNNFNIKKTIIDDVDKEIEIFHNIVNQVKENIKKLTATSDIFLAHELIASDPEFSKQVESYIRANKVNAAYAINKIRNVYLKTFDGIYDQYLQERKADILDVTDQMLSIALNKKMTSLSKIKEPTIIFANDLSPSQTADLNTKYIKGLVLFNGGATSHTAIIAKLHNIPTIINNNIDFPHIHDGVLSIVDANNFKVIQNPDQNTLKNYEKEVSTHLEKLANLEKYVSRDSLTTDNKKINVMANISNVEDLNLFDLSSVDGIGLFRTEFLYMGANLPTEEEQFNIYKEVLSKFGDKSVTIRTFDVGGDKKMGLLEPIIEENPFLGVRGIRYALKHREVFKIHLRALLRASNYGNLKIMFPMIATLEEILQSKELLSEVENELIQEGYQIGEYKIGIMVEIPSAALLANSFAKHVDFFSIGSNDLIQYTFAADRLNPDLNYLYQPFNPSLLRLIELTATAAKNNNIEVSVCGEMAAIKHAIPVLIGLDIDTLSMSPPSILQSKRIISKTNYQTQKEYSKEILNLTCSKDVLRFIKNNK